MFDLFILIMVDFEIVQCDLEMNTKRELDCFYHCCVWCGVSLMRLEYCMLRCYLYLPWSSAQNDTATIEEFHQEIQTIINFPLKEFIIPFLRVRLGRELVAALTTST